MGPRDAEALLEPAVRAHPGTWADLGCGDGTFTRALARRLGNGSLIFAVDRDERAIRSMERRVAMEPARVVPVVADFTQAFELPGLEQPRLDGLLMANALHYVEGAAGTLATLAAWLRPGGRVVLIEYDGRRPSRWVPYPIGAAEWPVLAATAGLTAPAIVARRASEYGGEIYAAIADRP